MSMEAVESKTVRVNAGPSPAGIEGWSANRSSILLVLLTLACLLPFAGRAFHVDDPLFLWAAQHITKEPLNPYGFQLIWDTGRVGMAEVTKNPPLACYYAAVVGAISGWSELAMHLGFLLPTLALVLGVYRLARRFTTLPLVAALAALLTPGLLVSASSVMCDTPMLALWVWAAIFWIEGLTPARPPYLVLSGLLIAGSALTKYFGVSLIPLLAIYAFARQRKLGTWVWYLLIPVAALAGFQLWTRSLYGQGLFLGAARFSASERSAIDQGSLLVKGLVGLSFAGGCALSALTLAPLAWARKKVLIAAAGSLAVAVVLALGWLSLGSSPQAAQVMQALHGRWPVVSVELAFCIAGGVSVLALAISDWWQRKDADSLFLALWVLGTFLFAGFLNWTTNARSILPLIPAVGILLARRLETMRTDLGHRFRVSVAAALVISGAVSLWVAAGDAGLANSAREAAVYLTRQTRNQAGTLWFEGHWGFQYYMERLGARAVDVTNPGYAAGDLVIVPQNNIQVFPIPRDVVASSQAIEIDLHQHVTTIRWELGAGFYSSFWGPLPFSAGTIPAERYYLLRIGNGARTMP